MTSNYIPLAKACELFPKVNGKHPSPRTLGRWGHHGLKGVKLGITRIGGRWFTTQEAIDQFIADCNGGREVKRVARRSQQETDRMKRLLQRRGYGVAGSQSHLLRLQEESRD